MESFCVCRAEPSEDFISSPDGTVATHKIIAGSALHGEQETLVMGRPGAVIMTDKGQWEVTWTGLSSR